MFHCMRVIMLKLSKHFLDTTKLFKCTSVHRHRLIEEQFWTSLCIHYSYACAFSSLPFSFSLTLSQSTMIHKRQNRKKLKIYQQWFIAWLQFFSCSFTSLCLSRSLSLILTHTHTHTRTVTLHVIQSVVLFPSLSLYLAIVSLSECSVCMFCVPSYSVFDDGTICSQWQSIINEWHENKRQNAWALFARLDSLHFVLIIGCTADVHDAQKIISVILLYINHMVPSDGDITFENAQRLTVDCAPSLFLLFCLALALVIIMTSGSLHSKFRPKDKHWLLTTWKNCQKNLSASLSLCDRTDHGPKIRNEWRRRRREKKFVVWKVSMQSSRNIREPMKC